MWTLYRRSDLIASIEAEHLKSRWRTSGFFLSARVLLSLKQRDNRSFKKFWNSCKFSNRSHKIICYTGVHVQWNIWNAHNWKVEEILGTIENLFIFSSAGSLLSKASLIHQQCHHFFCNLSSPTLCLFSQIVSISILLVFMSGEYLLLLLTGFWQRTRCLPSLWRHHILCAVIHKYWWYMQD